MFWPQNCCMALIPSSLIAITGFSSTCCSKRNVPGKDEKRGRQKGGSDSTMDRQEQHVLSIH